MWYSESIIIARNTIHDIFIEKYRGKIKLSFEEALYEVSKEVLNMSRIKSSQNKKEDRCNFIYLLSLLEFFDSMGFFFKNGDPILKEHIKNLFSGSIIFYYNVFRLYIKNAESKSAGRFKYFQELYDEINNSDSNIK